MDSKDLGAAIRQRAGDEADWDESYDAKRVYQWESGYRRPRKYLELIADEFHVAVGDLFSKSLQLSYKGPLKGEPVPVVSWGDIMKLHKGEGDIQTLGFVMPYDLADPKAFALIITDSSMRPVFREGDIIVISPSTKPSPGDYVVFELDGEPTFRQAHFYFNETHLKPLNPDYEELTIRTDDPTHHLIPIGTMVQKIERFK